MDETRLFQAMVEQGASDLFLKVEAVPCLRIHGRVHAAGDQRLTRADLLALIDRLLGAEQQRVLQTQRELNLAFERPGVGRFRANVLWEQGQPALVIRRVQQQIPTFEELRLPAGVLTRLCAEPPGLVLVTGPTGNGKSTTVSAMLESINRTRRCHIVTLEDPIETCFESRQAIITQREIGVDTRSFSDGLKNVFRQSPDVLFISDIRDQETMESALLAAESGQLVLSCVHTTNVMTTLERLISFFPPHQHHAARFRLSLAIKGIVCLRLLPHLRGGQIPACEVLVMTPRIRELLREDRPDQIPLLLRDGGLDGMQTFTQGLYELVTRGDVAPEQALRVADSPNELELALRHIRGAGDGA